MPRINGATDTNPCLISTIVAFEGRLAGTSLKVIERYSNSAGRGEIP